MKRKKRITNVSAEEWELYSSMPGRGEAAKVLTRLLREELAHVDAGDRAGGQAAFDRWEAAVAQTRIPGGSLEKWGALDTEPLNKALDLIEDCLGLQPMTLSR